MNYVLRYRLHKVCLQKSEIKEVDHEHEEDALQFEG